MRRHSHCPYCGKGKHFDCQCEYGSIMKAKMEPTERQQDFFHKKFCPKCGENSTHLECKHCGLAFSEEDFWVTRLW